MAEIDTVLFFVAITIACLAVSTLPAENQLAASVIIMALFILSLREWIIQHSEE